jgi:hypothetical protein
VGNAQALSTNPRARFITGGTGLRIRRWRLRSMKPSSSSLKRTRQSPASVSSTATSSPTSTSLTKINSPAQRISPFERTRRTAQSAAYAGSRSAQG